MKNNTNHFRVKKIKNVVDGVAREDKYIALVNDKTKLVTEHTNYADYVLYNKHQDLKIGSTADGALYAVCQFLNDIFIDKKDLYRINSIAEISCDTVTKWLTDYTHRFLKNGQHPLKQTVDAKRNAISLFLYGLCCDKSINMKFLNESDLITFAYVITPDGKRIMEPQYAIKIRYYEKEHVNRRIWRDMPLEIVERFIKLSQIYDPELTFAIVLMAYAGLREGEICNVRRKESCYGPGIILSYGQPLLETNGNELTSSLPCEAISIDIKDTLLLRSDYKFVGPIKSPRIQPVYGLFLNVVFHYYQQHIKLIANKPVEQYFPMFISRYRDRKTGQYLALTKRALQARMIRLFYNHVLPSLENDANPKFREFFQAMQNHTWGPHSFRHWYSVALVLSGADEVTLQTFRGDKSPSSARVYLERKGELERIYRNAASDLGRMIRDVEDNL